MRINQQKRSSCPINFALEEFGDLWSLLIIRDILLFEKKTYGEFLSSDEKIATNILANRLEKLMQNGVIEKKPHPSDKRKDMYQLTQKGMDLYPVMREMMLWSIKYDPQSSSSQDLTDILCQNNLQTLREAFQKLNA